MVSYYHADNAGTFISLDVADVIEALVFFRVRGRFSRGQTGNELRTYESCVFHLVFRIARVNVYAFDFYFCARGVEVFVFEFSEFAAVNCIRPIDPEVFEVEFVRPASHFFIWGEPHANSPVRDLGVRNKIFAGGHYLRNARFVVRAEKR